MGAGMREFRKSMIIEKMDSPLRASLAVLLATAAGVILLGALSSCAGTPPAEEGNGEILPADGEAPPIDTVEKVEEEIPERIVDEVLVPVDHPSWFTTTPERRGGERLVAGTGTSHVSGEEALWLAEAHAKDGAANIISALVESDWKQKSKTLRENEEVREREEIDYVTRILSKEPITGSTVVKREVVKGKKMKGNDPSGVYFQGFVLLKVPEENFEFSPTRCVKKANALIVENEVLEALSVMEGAVLCWPEDQDLLERLAYVQEKGGRLGDAMQTLQKLLTLCAPAEKSRIELDIARLDKQYAGGEFAFLARRFREVVKAGAKSQRLSLKALSDRARKGSTLDYTVLTDQPYHYYGLWLDDEGLFAYPAHERESGSRLGSDEGGIHVSLDVGTTEGDHLFVLVGALERPDWYAERAFLKDQVNRRAADREGRLPHKDLAGLIDGIEEQTASGQMITGWFAFDVTR